MNTKRVWPCSSNARACTAGSKLLLARGFCQTLSDEIPPCWARIVFLQVDSEWESYCALLQCPGLRHFQGRKEENEGLRLGMHGRDIVVAFQGAIPCDYPVPSSKDVMKRVWTFPTPFRSMGLLNENRFLPGDEGTEEERRGTLQNRYHVVYSNVCPKDRKSFADHCVAATSAEWTIKTGKGFIR